MNKIRFSFLVLAVTLASCASTPQISPVSQNPTSTRTPAEPTSTSAPTPTSEPTPLPGKLVLPIESLADEYPWLEKTQDAYPSVHWLGFNTRKAPFNVALVRQALSMGLDKQALFDLIADLARNLPYSETYTLPSSFTPPEILGRDLTNEIGLPFDPVEARRRLAEAGYSDPTTFPSFTFLIWYGGDRVPGFSQRVAERILQMWSENLGINSGKIEVANGGYLESLVNDPPEVFMLTWIPDYFDPDDFLNQIFFSEIGGLGYHNYTGFDDDEYRLLVDQAAQMIGAQERQILYIEAERMLNEDLVPLIPLYHYHLDP